MNLSVFLERLFESGRILVPTIAPFEESELEQSRQVLLRVAEVQTLNIPAISPGCCNDAALWAAKHIYRACQLSVYRDYGEEWIERELTNSNPGNPDRGDPAAHVAVDLTFRFLPDAIRFARSAAKNDPLLLQLEQWAIDWPLSSVGLTLPATVNGESLNTIMSHSALAQMYADRIIKQTDPARLDDPRVLELVAASLGEGIENSIRRHIDKIRRNEFSNNSQTVQVESTDE
ncbi:MAG: hypothetical protein ACI9G1_001447 [Pirellulaceae bacterium]|jgi:hypothetical protein